MVDHEIEFGFLKPGNRAWAVADDGRALIVERFVDGTLAAIWGPDVDPVSMPEAESVYPIRLPSIPDVRDAVADDFFDLRFARVSKALDAAGVPAALPYTDAERAGMGVAGCPVDPGAIVMIPLSERVAMLAAERDQSRNARDERDRVLDDIGDALEAAGVAYSCPRGPDDRRGVELEGGGRLATLAERVGLLAQDRDACNARLRVTAQILISKVGADGLVNADEVAVKAVKMIEALEAQVADLKSTVYEWQRATHQVELAMEKFTAGFAWKEPNDG